MNRDLIDKTVADIAKMQWWDQIKARKKALSAFPDATEAMIGGICDVAHEEWLKNVEFKKTAR